MSRALLMCSYSLCIGFVLAHTVLFLCVRVFKMLYLAERLWWMSQWRYSSVWVGFLYTEVSKYVVPSWGDKSVQEWNGSIAAGNVCWTVCVDQWNWCDVGTAGCVLLLDDKGVINIPKPKPGWMGSSADGLWFKLIYEQVSYIGTNGGTHGSAMDMFIIHTLKEKILFCRKNSGNVVMYCTGMEVLLFSYIWWWRW